MDFQFATSFNSEFNFTTQTIGDANFLNYTDSPLSHYTHASYISSSEPFEPLIYRTKTSSVLTEWLQNADADNNVVEVVPTFESNGEDVDEPDSVVSETSCTRIQGCTKAAQMMHTKMGLSLWTLLQRRQRRFFK